MDDNKKLHDYCDGRGFFIEYLPGNEQIAMAAAEGFVWCGSTETHDTFFNSKFRVYRYVNKETKRFYERRA